ncbi:hypothetical protein [uncultured Campylobacter sp.]|uniref:hypothetical protein n=1 Tax=uncultured Campylobacter sp. TaxID=218934 RepID=UPI002621AA25|nr:hypothetical protein [uncultured Campylobacter sp.]
MSHIKFRNLAALRDEILRSFFKPSFASCRSCKIKFYLIYIGMGGALKFRL